MVEVGNRAVGVGQPCFIIAEAGVNHNGSLDMARRLVDLAVDAGADAIKFQTFRAERLVTRLAPKAAYQRRNTGDEESQYEMLARLELPAAAYKLLFNHCQSRNIAFMSTPFDEESADLLDGLNVPAMKIGSGEITNHHLLEWVARKKRPIILSTGMANLTEVGEAVHTIRSTGNAHIVLLHCVSNYPADAKDANLRAMRTLSVAFGLPVGFSDHTSGIEVGLAAVALGACVIEKHLTADRSLPGPDHRASLEPRAFRELVRGIRTVEASLGHGRKEPSASELDIAKVARRSVVAAEDIPEGTVLTPRMLAVRRPGTGIAPRWFDMIVGRRTRVAVQCGVPLTLEMLA